ncbi:MAG TPA: hypothetical protein DEP84_12745 [Chloroflexi bacterium]|nr:hypothetical protein [Chloroflexota bacterium]
MVVDLDFEHLTRRAQLDRIALDALHLPAREVIGIEAAALPSRPGERDAWPPPPRSWKKRARTEAARAWPTVVP